MVDKKNLEVYVTDMEMFCKNLAMDQVSAIEGALERLLNYLEEFKECFSEESYKLVLCLLKKVKEKETNINNRALFIEFEAKRTKPKMYKARLTRVMEDC